MMITSNYNSLVGVVAIVALLCMMTPGGRCQNLLNMIPFGMDLASTLDGSDSAVFNNFFFDSNSRVYQSKYFNGNNTHRFYGGSCVQFFEANGADAELTCCSRRDDDCYMIHFDTRCYCDVACNKPRYPGFSEESHVCCPDAYETCLTEKLGSRSDYLENVEAGLTRAQPQPQQRITRLLPHLSKYYNGDEVNRAYGGSCEDFFANNTAEARASCCSGRDDQCYMIHYTTRCYCDSFCDRRRLGDNSDCCADGYGVCSALTPDNHRPEPEPTPAPEPEFQPAERTTPEPELQLPFNYCKKNGIVYLDGQFYTRNCRKCYCKDGVFHCNKKHCLIDEVLLNQINRNDYGWRASNYTEFWGQTLEFGFLHRLGAKLPTATHFGKEHDFFKKETNQFYDFRDEPFFQNGHANMIRDQGNCAASWAFSTADVLMDRAAKHEKRSISTNPSVEMLISCITHKNLNKCSAIEVDAAWEYIESFLPSSQGLVDENCYPLESPLVGMSGRCRIYEPDLSKCTDDKPYKRLYFKSTRAYQVRPHTIDIMHEIAKNGPVQMLFKVHCDFFMYKSGIYSPTPKASVPNVADPYHAVKVLGWGTENGIDYWIAANSWGPNWGEGGYFRIKREEPATEIGKHVYAAWGFYDR